MNEQTRNIPLWDMTGRIPCSVDPDQGQQAYDEIYPYLAGEQSVQNGLDE